MNKKKILIVDDDANIAELISLYLTKECFQCEIAEDGETALKLHDSFQPDLMLLDIMLPGIDGYDVCREIRKNHSTPIIMLSAKGEVFDKVLGLELGADDYIIKPFDSKEMVARVKAVLRRTERRGDRVLTWGDVELDPAAREVHKAGKPVELTYKEFELLKLLFSRRGVALTRDEILQAVWDYDYTGETRTVDMHVKALRQKLGEDIITTVRGVGYKMV